VAAFKAAENSSGGSAASPENEDFRASAASA
jgi:hypothetical protein